MPGCRPPLPYHDAVDPSGADHRPDDSATGAGVPPPDRGGALRVLEQVEAELGEVEGALRRLDDGSYGRCQACGRPIADERLEAMPVARFCAEHQGHPERPPGPG